MDFNYRFLKIYLGLFILTEKFDFNVTGIFFPIHVSLAKGEWRRKINTYKHIINQQYVLPSLTFPSRKH